MTTDTDAIDLPIAMEPRTPREDYGLALPDDEATALYDPEFEAWLRMTEIAADATYGDCHV